MSATVTHNLIIADRSESGIIAVASILEVCPLADEHISAWHNSTDSFFIFIAEHESGRIGSISAKNLDHLLDRILPELFAEHPMPHANSEFDIFVDDVVAGRIHDGVARLQISTALDAGRQTHNHLIGSESPPKSSDSKRPQQNTSFDLTKGERERSIRYLCRMWNQVTRSGSAAFRQPQFSDFEAWIQTNGYSHYLAIVAGRDANVDVEAWFNDELSRVARISR